MSFFEFPNTRTYDKDLGWVIEAMKKLSEAMESFIATNSLTFADPITHDLVRSYQKNTIVIDDNGNAFLSLQIVPAGIELSNTEYWLMIFDYEAFLEKVNKNFTGRYYRNQNRAVSAISEDDWLTFDDVLCKATADIDVDELLIMGTNIEAFTLEDFIKAFMTSATALIQQYKDDIDASELAYRQQLAGDIANTTASLQAQLDAAISGVTVDSEVINARVGADGVTYDTLGNAIRTQFTNIVKSLTDLVGVYRNNITYTSATIMASEFDFPVKSGTKIRYKIYGVSAGTGVQCRIYGFDGVNWSSYLDSCDYDTEKEYTFTSAYSKLRFRLTGTDFVSGGTAQIYIKVVSGGTVEESIISLLDGVSKSLKSSTHFLRDSDLSDYLPSGDLNDLSDGLIYFCNNLSIALHQPIASMRGVFFTLKPFVAATGTCQVFIATTGTICVRFLISGVWTDWAIYNYDNITTLYEDFYKAVPYFTSENLFNYNDCELGDFNAAGMEVPSDNVMRTITPIRFDGDYVISSQPCRKIFYDENMTFLERSLSTITPIPAPEGAVYVRFSIGKNRYDDDPYIMVNTGKIIKGYKAFSLYPVFDPTAFNKAFDFAASENNAILNNTYTKELYKIWKRAGVCGDSMSVGYSRDNVTQETKTRNLPYSWVKCIGRDAASYWLNFGTSGQNVLTWCSSDTYGKAQMEALNNKCQFYIIALGVNDVSDVPIGTPEDIVDDPDTVATTYYGGYARIVQLIKRRNSDAVILCMTMPNENSTNQPFNDAIRYIAGTKYTTSDKVFLIDLVKYKYLFTTIGEPLRIDKDNVSHYSSLGYQMISKIIETAISDVMIENHLDIINAAFIPYDTGEPTANTMTE